ncbi:MAG: PQQ-dependent dehydrogenase, methanol/ethanol family [Gammaproteobacteria bacterium]|nr:PQQ-dependent dehydrogenase, methanol/ethanol family [Gammaproteobacteria bacterium]
MNSLQPVVFYRPYRFPIIVVLVGMLLACGADTDQSTTEVMDSAQAPAIAPLEIPGELMITLPTHWLNEQDIGNGLGPVSNAMLETGHESGEQWLQYGGGYNNFRHSPITELSPENVGDLEFAWGFPSGTNGQFAASPVVYDGIMYMTASYNRLFALNAVTGELYWRYDHPQPADPRYCCGPTNRGVAIIDNKVIMATLDARLLAFDRFSGEILWNSEIEDYQRGFSATSAPLIVKNMAIIGVGGGEFGVRGFFDAFDINTGERVWRHYTVPAAGEPGVETWSGTSYETGGAPAWTIGAYDPELDTLYWTTGNPGPDWNGDARLGDNLYSDSVLALDPDTGERKWYFQFTPHDVWDYDGNTHLFLVDTEWQGSPVKAVVQANRNGFFYAINRETGAFLHANAYVEQLNWATSMEQDGRPVVDVSTYPSEEPIVRVCPGIAGGMNGSVSGALNPDLGLAFVPVIESCQMLQKGISVHVEGQLFVGGTFIPVDVADSSAYGHISAIDYASGEIAWRYYDAEPLMAGVLSTAGGLVFSGSQTGNAFALDAATGEKLWEFRLGSGIRSQPIAYQVDGESYVAIASGNFAGIAGGVGGNTMIPEGGHLFVFKLGEED